MTRTITVNSGSRDSLLLSAARQASVAVEALLRSAVEGEPLDEETIEKLCDAAKMTIEADSIGLLDGVEVAVVGDDVNQVLGALTRFLDGWAG